MKGGGRTDFWHEFTPWFVLACGLAATIAVTAFVRWTYQKQAAMRFRAAVLEAEGLIENRIAAYHAVLRGGAGLMAVNEDTSREQFRLFVALRLQTNYPGIQGVGFSRRVGPDEKEAIIKQARADGLTNFTIFPDKPGEEAHTILYLEPLDERNRAALGFDMSSETNRRTAMEKAQDSGQSAASAKVTLVQEIDLVRQAGFLIYTPVYRGGLVPPSVEERRKKLLGYIYAPFRADDLFAGIFGGRTDPHIEFDAYDGPAVNETALMHRSPRREDVLNARSMTASVDIVGRPWTFVFYMPRHFETTPLRMLTPLSAALGLLATGLLFATTLAQRKAHRFAHQHANQLEKIVAERTQSLRDTITSLEKFSYTIAHDLRAPVRTIYSFGSLLLEEHASQLDSTAQDYVRRINAGAKRMDSLIQDLLAYNRVEHEQVPLTRVALNSVFAAVLDESHERVRQSNARVRVEKLPEVIGNPTLLHQVAANLVNNALKFVPLETTPTVEVFAAEQNGKVRVTVKDNGIGIEPAHQRRIFGVFERLHSQEKYPGTGIGLAIVAKAIERMGGSVGVDSEPGRGSAFWFELPRAN